MRVNSHPEAKFLGYVQVRVASRVYALSVEATPLGRQGEAGPKPGFFMDGTGRFGIVVDSDAPDGVQRETIERASADAVRELSRKLLN